MCVMRVDIPQVSLADLTSILQFLILVGKYIHFILWWFVDLGRQKKKILTLTRECRQKIILTCM